MEISIVIDWRREGKSLWPPALMAGGGGAHPKGVGCQGCGFPSSSQVVLGKSSTMAWGLQTLQTHRQLQHHTSL